jgi:hypothetical protein
VIGPLVHGAGGGSIQGVAPGAVQVLAFGVVPVDDEGWVTGLAPDGGHYPAPDRCANPSASDGDPVTDVGLHLGGPVEQGPFVATEGFVDC